MDNAELRRSILQAKCPKLKLDGKDDSYVAEKGVALQDPPMVSMLLGWSLYRRGRR
jgi:hypothetical protein